jgi:hypothetical protein
VAFTTQEGTGGAPWTFLGTPENDSIAVITGDTQDTKAFDFIAEGFEGDDTINFNGTRSVTIKGGQGADVITNNVAASAALTSLISSSFINGNDGEDIIGNSQIGLLATLSTISGGQGEDEIFIGSLQSSKVNGNRAADFIEVGDLIQDENIVGSFSNFNAASIFGGQGDDVFEIVSEVRQFTNSSVAGQLGNDIMGIQIGVFDLGVAIADNIAFGFDPENGILADPSTRGTVFSGGEGDDILDASGLLVFDERDEASGSDLELVGNEGDDSIFGGIGEDLIAGNENDDWIAGYGGRDELFGGKGDDLVIGAYYDAELSVGFIGDGAGDLLSGGTGSNRFFVPGSESQFITTNFFPGNPLGSTQPVVVSDQVDEFGFGGTISDGDVLFVAFGADVITDWNAGAGANVLDTGIGNSLAGDFGVFGGNPFMSLGEFYNSFEFGDNYAVRGFYTERFNESGEFTVSQFGTDIAVWTNYFGDGFPEDEFGIIPLESAIDNLTVLQNVPSNTVLTANEFVSIG